MTPDIIAERIIVAMKSEWESLVDLVFGGYEELHIRKIAGLSGKSYDSILNKVKAIEELKNLAFERESIKSYGEYTALSLIKKRIQEAKHEKGGRLTFVIPISQREKVLEVIDSISSVLGLTTREAFFDFFLSVFGTMEPDEIKHLAGHS